MTLLPLIDCSQMLAIDAKTLRHWLRQANIPLHPHPSDARVKCLMMEHVRHLAVLHGRTLKPAEVPTMPLLATDSDMALVQASALHPETDLLAKLSQLETQVSIMQQHLAGLALELLQERTLRYEQRLQTLERLLGPTQHPAAQPQAHQNMEKHNQLEEGKPQEQYPHRQAKHAPSHVIPLIEYGAGGTYVVICPKQGELSLIPDSSAWFDWLATLSSFRFMGQLGRLSTYRNHGRSCWMAYRRIHGRRYDYGLGNTKHLTIAHLEQMAATLQSYVPSL